MMKKLSVGLLVALALAVNASAMMISVNFDKEDDWVGPMPSDSEAGVVPLANWNNVSIDAGSVAAGGLVQSDGSVADGVSMAWAGFGDTWWTGAGGDVGIYGDCVRLGTNELTISGVQGTYNLIVYAQDFGDNNAMSITVNGITKTGTNTTTNQTFGSLGFIEDNNYFRFNGLSGTATMTAEDNRQIAGLQVIPEPGTIALLGLMGFALFIRRRFSK